MRRGKNTVELKVGYLEVDLLRVVSSEVRLRFTPHSPSGNHARPGAREVWNPTESTKER
jgi:hypothetical protein